MVTTNKPARSRRGRDTPPEPVAAEPSHRPAAAPPVPRTAPRVTRRAAAREVRALADGCDSVDQRRRLRRLADEIRRRGGGPRGPARLESAAGAWLDEAAALPAPQRWPICEAVTWAVAWIARSRRSGGSAGGLLERLVREARGGLTALAGGDTRPATFVLVLARLFRDVEACHLLEADAARAVAAEIDRLVAPGGGVHLPNAAALLERVTRWTAVRDVARLGGDPVWDDATEARWQAAAGMTLRHLAGKGCLPGSAGPRTAASAAPLLDSLRRVAGRLGRTARVVRRGPVPKRSRSDLLPSSAHDPAAAVAVLRAGWDRDALRVLLDYRDAVPRLEVAVGDRLLCAGPWSWEVTADGRPLDMEAGWTASCWESGRKATFVEITAPLAGGRQIERHVVLLPRDRIVLLADALTMRVPAPPAGAGLRYRGGVPLATGLEAEGADETREVLLFDTAPRGVVLPPALPEWRSAGRGSFTAAGGALVLEQESAGARLYAPLWLDCEPRRVGGPLTWRQLTVADTRRILPPYQAAGFRVQAGLRQWLLYRALDVPRNRTLLGCNVSCEFLLGRIKPSGVVARTLEIQ